MKKAKKDILIIDDDEHFIRMVKEILENKGYTVDSAPNGNEGRKLMREKIYKVIGTDIIMPNGDGFEVIMDAKEQGFMNRVIAWSAGGRTVAEDYLDTVEHYGVHNTFKIPLDIPAFLTVVARMITEQN